MAGRLDRREFLAGAAAALSAPLLPSATFAASPTGTPLHGLSAFGELKYPPDFEHFDYINPDAPKGGQFSFTPPTWGYNQSTLSFNTLNFLVPGGDSPPRMELCFDALMTRAIDEPDAVYGLLAESVTISADRNSFEFALRPEARFNDGSPLTAEDAAFSFMLLKEKGHPVISLTLASLVSAAAEGPHKLVLTFSGRQSSRTILAAVEYPIVSRAFFEKHPFDSSQLVAPLGSGPYRVAGFANGQRIDYERVADYWGRDLPVNRGRYHFDRIRVDLYRDRQAGFEAFKKGDILYRQEATSRLWATAYDFPALTEGKVVKREFPGELWPRMQAFALNQRRERFRDVRVRTAIALCFDFEWTNRTFFFNSYERSHSLFVGSPYEAEGLPSPEELALLEPLREALPAEVFGEAVTQPASDGSGSNREGRRRAAALLADAGWTRKGGVLEDGNGERLTVEMLVEDEAFERIQLPFAKNLRSIGVDASVRRVDSTQFQARQADFDFDMVSAARSFSALPSRDELEALFHSKSASLPSSANLPGTADPAVDALIEAVGRAGDEEELRTAMLALDRVLRARKDWIPNWNKANHWVAYWDMLGFREPKPDYGFPVEELWWFDNDKAAAIGKG